MKAISEMNVREFLKYWSTEKYLMSIYTQYDKTGNFIFLLSNFIAAIKYVDDILKYYIDMALIKSVSSLKESAIIDAAINFETYDLQDIKRYSSKELTRFLIDLIRKHYSSKFLFDDSHYVANIIRALGNVLNTKMLSETLNEIIRQAKIQLTFSMSKNENIIGSHNYIVLKACIQSLTKLYESMKICLRQLNNNESIRKQNAAQSKLSKEELIKQNSKSKSDSDSKSKILQLFPQITKFMKDLLTYEIYDKNMDLQILHFRFRITKTFANENFLVSSNLIKKIHI